MSSPYQTSGDTGSGDVGVNLDSHVTGNPIAGGSTVGAGASVTVGHTFVIIIGALILLWVMGGFLFKNVRM